MTTSVMKFGVHSISGGEGVAVDEMAAAHSYYNEVLAEKKRMRAEWRTVRARHVPGLNEAEDHVVAISEEISAEYTKLGAERKRVSAQKNGKRAKPTKLSMPDEQRSRIDGLKKQLKEARKRARELRAEFDGLVGEARKEFDARATGAPRKLIDQIHEIGAQLKAAKRQKDNPDVAKLKATLDALKKTKKEIAPSTHKKREANRAVLEQMMDEDWHQAWKEQAALDAETNERLIALRAASGLSHGTYTAVEEAVELACKTAHGEPRFQNWEVMKPGRKIGQQLQKGKRPLTGAAFYAGTDPRLRVVHREPLRGRRDSELRIERSAHSDRNHWEYVTVEARLKDGRTLTIETLLHRPIPDDAVLTWWYLVPRKGSITLQVTVDHERPLVERKTGIGECKVRLRWARDEKSGGIVVADVNGEPFVLDGPEYQARSVGAPLEKRSRNGRRRRGFAERGGAVAGMIYARGLKSGCDHRFEEAKHELCEWLDAHDAPEWLDAATRSIKREVDETGKPVVHGRGPVGTWRNHKHMHRVASAWADGVGLDREAMKALWKEWRTERKRAGLDLLCEPSMPPCQELFEWLDGKISDEWQRMGVWLEWWRRKDLHMAKTAEENDRKARANRKDQYRRKARELSERYGAVVVVEHNLAETARRRKPGEDEDEATKQARWQRTVAAPSEFKAALRLAFGIGRFRIEKREWFGDTQDPGIARKSENGRKVAKKSAVQVAAE